MGGRLLDALGARAGERRVGLVDRDRGGERVLVPTAGLLSPERSLGTRARKRGRHDDQRDERRRGDPERDGRLPAGDADRDGQREAHARDRLHQHEPAEQGEALVPGQPAAREVARRVGERADDEHEVERFLVVVEDVVDQRVVQRQRDDQEDQRESWPGSASAHASCAATCPLRTALGDRAREQLFDRPVDHRDDHEHDRPQQVDPLGRLFAEHVAGDREVRERQQARRGDPDREDARPAAVGAGGLARRRIRTRRALRWWRALAGRGAHRYVAAIYSRTSSIVQGNGERASTTSPWRASSS